MTDAHSWPAFRLVGDSLGCRRGERLLFRGLSFDLAAGAALALTGPNGVGKTSLLRVIAGLLEAESGAVRLDGADAERDRAEYVHFAGAREALKAALRPVEMLRFWHAMAPLPAAGTAEAAAEAALDALGLLDLAEIPCGYLSSGQRRRVALARLLVDRRPVWLLDEPTNALDRAATARLAGLVESHRAAGGIVVAATHLDLGWPGLVSLALEAYRTAPARAAEAAA